MGSAVFAFILIMVVGGFIAYFGDRLGYVMGKKRVTLFGLRPRHTAQALTITAGVVIGGLALGFLLIVNATFRTALLTGAHLRTVNRRLELVNRQFGAEVGAEILIAKNSELAAARAQSQSDRAKDDLVTETRNLTLEQAKTESIKKDLTTKQATLAKLKVALTKGQVELAAVTQQVQIKNNELQLDVNHLGRDVQVRRSGTLIYRDNGELGRVVIPVSLSKAQIRSRLVQFLNQLSTQASYRGAAVGTNGRSVVVETVVAVDIKTKETLPIYEDVVLDSLASSIHSHANGSVVVIGSAAGNSFNGSQVIVKLWPYANVLAIRAGTVLGQTTLPNGGADVDSVAQQIQQFLVSDVRKAAITAGVIPVRDALTGQIGLGGVSLQQIYDIVSSAKQIKGSAVVTATAVNNVYSADQLRLSFTVEPENSNGSGQ